MGDDDSGTTTSASDCDDDDSCHGPANSDSWDEDDEDSGSEDMSQFEAKFRAALDHKVRIAEMLCDHKDYVFSFAPPRGPCPPEVTNRLDNGVLDPLTAMTHVPKRTVQSPPPSDAVSDIESARDEIARLRTAREVFVSHKTEVGDRLKEVLKDSEGDVRWLYECEEAVEAIDTIIDFKNEIICGREGGEALQLFSENSEEGELIMERLKNLSSTERDRLFCKFFKKVVELRHSSKLLERSFEELHTKNEKMKKRQKYYIREIEGQDERLKFLTESHSGGLGRDEQPPSTSLRHPQHHNFSEALLESARHRDHDRSRHRDHNRSRHRDHDRLRHHRPPIHDITMGLRKITIHTPPHLRD